ncbi:hypothetical protein D9M72_470520 [compost metagenome]
MRSRRIDRVHAHPLLAVGIGQSGAGQHQCSVSCATRQVGGVGHLAPHAHNVDDGAATLLRHALDHRVNHIDVAEVLGGHCFLPQLWGQLVRRPALGRSGGGHQNVDAAKSCHRFFHRACGLGDIGQIGGYRDHVLGKFALAFGQLGAGLRQVLGAARNDGHARALTQKAGRASEADAAAAAGDEHPLIAEFEIHDGVPWLVGSAGVVRQMAHPHVWRAGCNAGEMIGGDHSAPVGAHYSFMMVK